jgi:Rrf2 family protein
MRLSRPVDYALRAMRLLATLPADEEATRSVLSDRLAAPEPFLAKVMRRLAVAELVESRRGVGGGFRLSRPPEQISMLQVVEAVEGSAGLNACFLSSDPCSCDSPCGAHAAFAGVRAAMLRALKNTSVADLCRENATPSSRK